MVIHSPFPDIEIPQVPFTDFVLAHAGEIRRLGGRALPQLCYERDALPAAGIKVEPVSAFDAEVTVDGHGNAMADGGDYSNGRGADR